MGRIAVFRLLSCGVSCLAGLVPSPVVNADDDSILLEPIGRYATGLYDESAAEICAHDPVSQRVFVTNAADSAVDVISIVDPMDPMLVFQIDTSPFGEDVTSVAFRHDLGAIAVGADPKTDPGTVVFFDRDGVILGTVLVGALPDSITFTPDGRYLLVANEGEPNDEYTVDPEGSVSIIDTRGGVPTQGDVRTADFRRFDSQKQQLRKRGVRIFGPTVVEVDDGVFEVTEGGASVSQDLEPEYVTASEDSRTAWCSLQENNALAVIDLRRARVTKILPLGYKLHLRRKNSLDASNEDDAINIRRWPNRGMYQPDWVNAFTVKDKTYLITANEGDARDYDTFSEETRVGDLTLGGLLARIEGLQDDENLGRLLTTSAPPSGKKAGAGPDGENVYRTIYSYGARSFSIWTGSGGRVFDSGSQLEDITARIVPDDFNSTDDANDSFDNRSDDKGPEPEAVVVGEVEGRQYAFIGLERVGGIIVYDVSRPNRPSFVQYINNRDFSVEMDIGDCNDCEDDCVDDCEDCADACEECESCPDGEECLEACEICDECSPEYDGCTECSPDTCLAVAECTSDCEDENCPVAGVEGRDPIDLAPEGLLFIPADESPDGFGPLLVVSNEVSGSTTIYAIWSVDDEDDEDDEDEDEDEDENEDEDD